MSVAITRTRAPGFAATRPFATPRANTQPEHTHAHRAYTGGVKSKLKKNAFFTDPARGGEIFALKNAYSGPAMKDAIEKRYPGAVVLNALSVESAIEVFKANDERLRKAEAEAKAAKKPKGP